MFTLRSSNRGFFWSLSCSIVILASSFPVSDMAQNGSEDEGELRELKGPVNSEHQDLSPVLNLEEDILFFTSDRPTEGGETGSDLNVFISERGTDGAWKEPRPLPFNNEEKDEMSVGISPRGDLLFLNRGGDLYKVEREDGEWGEPQAMSSRINSKHNETRGSIRSDGNAFYFGSDRDGNMDVYRVKRLPTGEWGKPQKLPRPINTSEAENAPFIHPDGKTLFFSSKGHVKEPRSDIFYSKRREKGDWSPPVKMGYPISTEGNDVHVMTSADGKRAYFASSSIDEEGEDKDLYRYDLKGVFTEGLAVLKGFIDVPQGSDLLDSVVVQVKPKKGSQEFDRPHVQRPRKRDGVFIAVLPPCHEYQLSYNLGEEVVLEQELFVPCRSSYQKIRKEVFLEPVEFDPSELERHPSFIGSFQHASNGAPVSKGSVRLVDDDGKATDSLTIGPKGSFSFYHPEKDQETVLFHYLKEGSCANTDLRMRSQGDTLEPIEKDGCVYRFPFPR